MKYFKRKTGKLIVVATVLLAGLSSVSAKSMSLYGSPDGLSDNPGSKKKPMIASG